MIRKQSSEGVGYAVVELGDVRHVFVAAAPRVEGDLARQARDALDTVREVIAAEGRHGSIVHQAVFLRDAADAAECRTLIREFYGAEMPATAYIPQPPGDGRRVAIEALGVGGGQGDVEIQRLSENLVIARHHGFAWVHCGEVTPQTASPSVYDRSTDAFRRMRDVLASAGVGFEQVIRTWLYLGDIVGPEGQRQRYQELNRARTDFYRDIRFLATHGPQDRPVYPASTGIGSNDLDVRMSCIALVTGRADVTVTPLENPQQTSACEYGLQYGPKSPKFSRAIVVAAGPSASIFISGTASITGQESRHEDAAEQTRQTLDNIETLIAEANCRRHGLPGRGATLAELALARVYIKRPEDFECVRAVCRGRLGELPTIYAVADICRPELLVEIEGIAFSGSRLLVG